MLGIFRLVSMAGRLKRQPGSREFTNIIGNSARFDTIHQVASAPFGTVTAIEVGVALPIVASVPANMTRSPEGSGVMAMDV